MSVGELTYDLSLNQINNDVDDFVVKHPITGQFFKREASSIEAGGDPPEAWPLAGNFTASNNLITLPITFMMRSDPGGIEKQMSFTGPMAGLAVLDFSTFNLGAISTTQSAASLSLQGPGGSMSMEINRATGMKLVDGVFNRGPEIGGDHYRNNFGPLNLIHKSYAEDTFLAKVLSSATTLDTQGNSLLIKTDITDTAMRTEYNQNSTGLSAFFTDGIGNQSLFSANIIGAGLFQTIAGGGTFNFLLNSSGAIFSDNRLAGFRRGIEMGADNRDDFAALSLIHKSYAEDTFLAKTLDGSETVMADGFNLRFESRKAFPPGQSFIHNDGSELRFGARDVTGLIEKFIKITHDDGIQLDSDTISLLKTPTVDNTIPHLLGINALGDVKLRAAGSIGTSFFVFEKTNFTLLTGTTQLSMPGGDITRFHLPALFVPTKISVAYESGTAVTEPDSVIVSILKLVPGTALVETNDLNIEASTSSLGSTHIVNPGEEGMSRFEVRLIAQNSEIDIDKIQVIIYGYSS